MKFSDLNQSHGRDIEEWIQKKEFNYEASVVALFLKHFNITTRRAELEKRCEEVTGHKTLTFAWFHDAYPGFPTRLGTRKIPDISQTRIYEMHNVYLKDGKIKDKFFSSRIWKEYETLLEQFDKRCGAVGMVFPCKQIPNYILHNSTIYLSRAGSWLVKTDAHGRSVTLEPLKQWLDAVGEWWRP